jgi:alpha-N-arabinofuranosidase
VESPDYAMNDRTIAGVSASASIDHRSMLHLSISNLHHEREIEVNCEIRGRKVAVAGGRILTADAMDGHNSFDDPNRVRPAEFKHATAAAAGVAMRLPARSVVVLALRAS